MFRFRALAITVCGVLLLAACSDNSQPTATTTTATPGSGVQNSPDVFSIIAGSEQKTILDQIVLPWCKDHGYKCSYTSKGSVDQAVMLQSGNVPYDAMWFASTVFWQIGDKQGLLKHVKPMFSSPVVFAARKAVLQSLGFLNREVKVADILDVASSGKAKVWMTNPAQSNSGASVYLAFLNSFAGNGPGQALTMDQLNSPQVADQITKFLRSIDKTSPSTGDLTRACVATLDRCQALFTYEALVIETNQQLVKDGKEPLYAIYPSDGTAIADSPLGYFSHNDANKEKIFQEMQDYLLSDQGVQKIRALGRRAGAIGLKIPNPDKAVFNPDWGIDATRVIQPISFPEAQVIEAALSKYQTAFRSPVHAVYCLDGSGSMATKGWDDLVQAAEIVFDQTRAAQYYLQAHPDDITTVAIFNSVISGGPWTVKGNDPAQMRSLYTNIQSRQPEDGTNLYTCLNMALTEFNQNKGENRKRLIILMTDGQSDLPGQDEFLNGLKTAGNIPVISIAFGDADKTQLTQLADASGGTVVNQQNLVDALREATGYK
jgi:Ca-activated chloride channel family protein